MRFYFYLIHEGVYIPQNFAEKVKREFVKGITDADYEILMAGPDHELYWDAWDTVLTNARIKLKVNHRYDRVLHQDGDLFIGTRKQIEMMTREQ